MQRLAQEIGAAGVVRSPSDNRWQNLPPRLRPLRRLRGIFFMGAATPPFQGFPRRGVRLSLQFSISLVRTRHAACIEVEAELEVHGRRFRAPDRPGGPHMNLQRTRAVARKEASISFVAIAVWQ